MCPWRSRHGLTRLGTSVSQHDEGLQLDTFGFFHAYKAENRAREETRSGPQLPELLLSVHQQASNTLQSYAGCVALLGGHVRA